jgi:hypothetical protein
MPVLVVFDPKSLTFNPEMGPDDMEYKNFGYVWFVGAGANTPRTLQFSI